MCISNRGHSPETRNWRGFSVISAGEFVDRIDQDPDVFRRRKAGYAMPEIEDMAAATSVVSKHFRHAVTYGRCFCQKHRGLEVALQRCASAHSLARRTQVHGPVDSYRIAPACGDGFEP